MLTVRQILARLWFAAHMLVQWPYYRTFVHRTVQPAVLILHEQDPRRIADLFNTWVKDKADELLEVKTAATVSAAGSIGMVTSEWVQEHSPWYAMALWYAGLITAIFALISSAQQNMLLMKMRIAFVQTFPNFGEEKKHGQKDIPFQFNAKSEEFLRLKRYILSARGAEHTALGPIDSESGLPPRARFLDTTGLIYDWRLSKQMMFVWQCPLLFLSYSWLYFIIALTAHVIRPPLSSWDNHAKVVAFYLVVAVPSFLAFFWCGMLPVWHASQDDDHPMLGPASRLGRRRAAAANAQQKASAFEPVQEQTDSSAERLVAANGHSTE